MSSQMGLEEEPRCEQESRSNWPVWHYDGRWRCSLPVGHLDYDIPHLAFFSNDPKWGICWVRPWTDDPEPKPKRKKKH